MSNQYKNALDHAYAILKDEVDKYGISVDGAERMIVWRGSVIPVKLGTSQRECLRILRGIIAAEKKQEQLKQLENQQVLL